MLASCYLQLRFFKSFIFWSMTFSVQCRLRNEAVQRRRIQSITQMLFAPTSSTNARTSRKPFTFISSKDSATRASIENQVWNPIKGSTGSLKLYSRNGRVSFRLLASLLHVSIWLQLLAIHGGIKNRTDRSLQIDDQSQFCRQPEHAVGDTSLIWSSKFQIKVE